MKKIEKYGTLGELYSKIRNGNATEMDKQFFELEIAMRSWKKEYILQCLEEAYLEK